MADEIVAEVRFRALRLPRDSARAHVADATRSRVQARDSISTLVLSEKRKYRLWTRSASLKAFSAAR